MRAKVLHLKHLRHLTFALFLLANPHHVVTRSAFWDTDLIILAILVLYEFKYHIAVDSVWLATIELTEEHCLALIRIHAFKGNDYVSSFFKGGKVKKLEDFYNFELASKCELPAKNDIDISLSSCKNLFALCLVQKSKIKSGYYRYSFTLSKS